LSSGIIDAVYVAEGIAVFSVTLYGVLNFAARGEIAYDTFRNFDETFDCFVNAACCFDTLCLWH
jgi:hypothetical protein